MYWLVERALLKEFVRSNLILIRVVILIVVLAQPIILIFGPLPAYLFYVSDISSIVFWLSFAFLFGISYLSSTIYDAIVTSKHDSWVTLVAGRVHFFVNYSLGQTRFAVLTIVALMLGWFKVDEFYPAIIRLILFISLLVLLYVYRAKRRLRGEIRSSIRSPYYHLFLSFVKPVIFHLIIYVSLFSSLPFLLSIDNYSVVMAYAAIVMLVLLLLVQTTFRIVRRQIELSATFLRLVDDRLYRNIGLITNGIYFLMLSSPILFLMILLLSEFRLWY